jgi:1,4-dihydroxy-2-naphthoate octaprenyltransferase
MRDIENDALSNKITLAVKLGRVKAKVYHYSLISIALASALVFGVLNYKSPYSLLFLIAFIPILLHLKRVYKNTMPHALDPELKKLALSTVLLAILLGIVTLL